MHLQIIAKWTRKQIAIVEVTPDYLVSRVKHLILAKTTEATKNGTLFLYYNDLLLDDEEKLRYYGIEKENTVLEVIIPRDSAKPIGSPPASSTSKL